MTKFDKVWELMLTHEFEIISKESKYVHCTLCKKIMIDPLVSECEYQFCFLCIREYLERTQICPGCQNHELDFNKNFAKDFRARNEIVKLVAKCKNDPCDFKVALEDMDCHLRVCGMREFGCPYVSIGCNANQVTIDYLKIHSESDWLNHSKLLMESIVNLKNDVENSRRELGIKDKEIIILKEDSDRKEGIIREIRELFENQQKEIQELNERIDQRDSELSGGMNIRSVLEEHTKEIMKEMKSLITKDDQRFNWRIDNFLKRTKNGHVIRSSLFYRDSYKMYLCVDVKNESLSFWCHIMKGEFDDCSTVEWPMIHTVTLGISNLLTTKTHKQVKYNYDTYLDKEAFNKSKTILNDKAVGDGKFLALEDIITIPGLRVDDSVLLYFMVEYR